jgi:hypothetical protein
MEIKFHMLGWFSFYPKKREVLKLPFFVFSIGLNLFFNHRQHNSAHAFIAIMNQDGDKHSFASVKVIF